MLRIQRAGRRFVRNRRGGVATTFALSLFVICGVVGLSIDGLRAYRMKSRIGAVIDSAALAGAKLLANRNATDSEVQAAVNAVLLAANQELATLWATVGQATVAVDRSANTVALQIGVAVPTTFAQVIGISNLDFTSATRVAYKIQSLELAMVLDVTGSMNNDGKLDAMKASASTVIDALMASAQFNDTVRIGLVPFAASVNTGTYASRVTGSPTSMDNCVLERSGVVQLTDAPPIGVDSVPWVDPAVASAAGSRYSCPVAEIVPLTDNTNSLKATIQGYVASGWTAGHIGTAWGWYLLSPSWGSIWPYRPGSYTDPNVVKAMILLTDGIFNASYTAGLATPEVDQVNEAYANFGALCTAAKATSITIYTIALDLTDPRALEALRACASSDSRAFQSPTAEQLQGVFMQIVQDLNVLRVIN